MTCHSQPLALPAASEKGESRGGGGVGWGGENVSPKKKQSSGSDPPYPSTHDMLVLMLFNLAAHKMLVSGQWVDLRSAQAAAFISSAELSCPPPAPPS